jgi:hypothetical protein
MVEQLDSINNVPCLQVPPRNYQTYPCDLYLARPP